MGPRVNTLEGTSAGTGVILALKRKLRNSDNSLVLTIPSQVTEMCGFEIGWIVEVEAIGRDSLRFSLTKTGEV